MNPPVRGRFAPSPTGRLHLGSLTTAVASFCHIKSLGGQWLVRIEDTDFERCRDEYTTAILSDLENLGLYADQDIIHQSARVPIYHEFLGDVLSQFTYHCYCSRKSLNAYFAQQTHALHLPQPNPPNSHLSPSLSHTQDLHTPPIYPRICLGKHSTSTNAKLRLILPDVHGAFFDGICGVIWDNPARSLGDVVVKRQNGMINYILSCAIDDGLQNISHIMRGVDILPMTLAQIWLITQCQLPVPQHFYHLPLLHNPDGQKLSKQNLATPINTQNSDQARQLLISALRLLGQNIPADMMDGTPEQILGFASRHWQNAPLLHKHSLGVVT